MAENIPFQLVEQTLRELNRTVLNSPVFTQTFTNRDRRYQIEFGKIYCLEIFHQHSLLVSCLVAAYFSRSEKCDLTFEMSLVDVGFMRKNDYSHIIVIYIH